MNSTSIEFSNKKATNQTLPTINYISQMNDKLKKASIK